MIETFIATMIALGWTCFAAYISSYYMAGKSHTVKLTHSILIGFPTAVALIVFIIMSIGK